MEKMKELKNWLKTAAIEIRLRRNLYKDHQRKRYFAFGWGDDRYREYRENFSDLSYLRNEYRHMHIAYSELRGKTRNQIEAKCNDPASEEWIRKIKYEYGKQELSIAA